MRLTDFPAIYKILIAEKLEPLQTIDRDKLICSDLQGQKFLIKDSKGLEETIFTQVFPAIKTQQGLSFEVLELLPASLTAPTSTYPRQNSPVV